MKLHALAVDVGGTNVRVALVDRHGRVHHKRSRPTESQRGRAAILEHLFTVIREVIDISGLDTLCGIGVSQAGATDPGTGVIRGSPNLPGWDGLSLKADLERNFSSPVVVANDANAAADPNMWSPKLDGASRDKLTAIQNEKLAAVTPFLYEISAFYRNCCAKTGITA